MLHKCLTALNWYDLGKCFDLVYFVCPGDKKMVVLVSTSTLNIH